MSRVSSVWPHLRKQRHLTRSNTQKQHHVTPYEVESILSDIKWEDTLRSDVSIPTPVSFTTEEIQDLMEDVVALQLAMLQSREEVTEATSRIGCGLDCNADGFTDLGDGCCTVEGTAAASKVLDVEDCCSDATDQWDLCETSSISSSWLDVQYDNATEQVIGDEDDLVILNQCSAEALPKAAKPPSFAEVLARSVGASPAPLPRLVKSRQVTSRLLKAVPEYQTNEHDVAAVEDWEMYKSPNLQHWGRSRRARKK